MLHKALIRRALVSLFIYLHLNLLSCPTTPQYLRGFVTYTILSQPRPLVYNGDKTVREKAEKQLAVELEMRVSYRSRHKTKCVCRVYRTQEYCEHSEKTQEASPILRSRPSPA